MTSSTLEIELKFLIKKSYIEGLQDFLNAHAKPLETLQLANIYFDTPDGICQKNRMGLRIRRWNDQCEQTIKMSGKVAGAMSARPEYTCSCDQERPDLTVFAAEIWPADFDVAAVNRRLKEQFRTDFQRQRWLYQAHGLEVEFALDIGAVRAGELEEPICELEIELVQGDIARIESLLAKLRQQVPLEPGALSKAQRGYALLNQRR